MRHLNVILIGEVVKLGMVGNVSELLAILKLHFVVLAIGQHYHPTYTRQTESKSENDFLQEKI